MKKLKIHIEESEMRRTIHVKLPLSLLRRIDNLMSKDKILTYQKLFEYLAKAYEEGHK